MSFILLTCFSYEFVYIYTFLNDVIEPADFISLILISGAFFGITANYPLFFGYKWDLRIHNFFLLHLYLVINYAFFFVYFNFINTVSNPFLDELFCIIHWVRSTFLCWISFSLIQLEYLVLYILKPFFYWLFNTWVYLTQSIIDYPLVQQLFKNILKVFSHLQSYKTLFWLLVLKILEFFYVLSIFFFHLILLLQGFLYWLFSFAYVFMHPPV